MKCWCGKVLIIDTRRLESKFRDDGKDGLIEGVNLKDRIERNMNASSYPFRVDDSCHIFRFTSTGMKTIEKVVVFDPLPIPGIYMLVLGDFDEDEIDVGVKSNNRDLEMVLSTVVKIIAFFLSDYPDASIFVEGSSAARNRLYRIMIEKERKNWRELFVIKGIDEDTFEVFQSGKNYSSYLISLCKT
ncbi:DUF6934 family protein [Dyadobacter sp. MSC1_007]|jgi:hypothetical protein